MIGLPSEQARRARQSTFGAISILRSADTRPGKCDLGHPRTRDRIGGWSTTP
ncbi:hypothetical protein H4W33_005649 [Kibdelosporangium phytohabitans]|nr:hypothetical protein [Kibdelosporangium phytohabitans]